RGATVRGHEMSVRTVCLGWHWRPYQYSRDAVDVNGNRVLDMPDWMVRMGRKALVAATGDPHAGDEYTPDTALVNYYDEAARMGRRRPGNGARERLRRGGAEGHAPGPR